VLRVGRRRLGGVGSVEEDAGLVGRPGVVDAVEDEVSAVDRLARVEHGEVERRRRVAAHQPTTADALETA
jgi:hypothetical protein